MWVWVNSRSWWWTGRPGMLRFTGSQRVGHDWATDLIWIELRESNHLKQRRQWHPTPVLLPGKSHGWRSLVGYSPWGRWGSDTTWATSLSLFTFMHWRRKWQPTPVFLPGESQGRGSLVGCHLWGTQSQTWLKWLSSSRITLRKLPRWLGGKESPYNAGDKGDGLIPELGRSPGGGNNNPLQYSCLKNAMDRGSWHVTVHGVAQNKTRLSDWAHTHAITSRNFLLLFLLLSLKRKWERLEARNLMCHSCLWRLGSHEKEP